MSKTWTIIAWSVAIFSGLCLISYYFPNTSGEQIGRILGAFVFPAALGLGLYFHFRDKKKKKGVEDGN